MFIPFFIFLAASVHGQALVGSIPDIGNEDENNVIQGFVKAHKETITIKELPNERSLHYIKKGKLDFYYPVLLPLSNVKKKFDYTFSDITLSTVVYAVYVNKKNSTIAVHNLQDYIIEGESGHVDFFDFRVVPSSCVECSFRKVETGRVDGYIYPAFEGDKIVKHLKLNNIDSYYFDTYEIKFALPLGEKGRITNGLLTKLAKDIKLSKSSSEQKIWQPTRKQ